MPCNRTNPEKERSYPFTINNPQGFEWDGVSEIPNDPFGLFELAMNGGAKYVIYSYEVGIEGTPHCQGWVQLKAPQRKVFIHKWGGEWAHAAIMTQIKGDDANVNYCSKENDITHVAGPWEVGERTLQGERSDMSKAMDLLRETRSLRMVAMQFPETYARYSRGFKEWLEATNENHRMDLPELRPWQAELMEIINGPVHPRKVYWYYDHVGGAGKTAMSIYLEGFHDGLILCAGRHDRMQEAYQGQRVVVFDFTREMQDRVPYCIIETVKNGRQHGGFYGRGPRGFSPPHVIIFANFLPDESKLSADRWEIKTL